VHFLGLQAASAVVGLIAGLFLELIAFPTGVPAEQMPAEKVASLGLFVCAVMAVASGLLILVVRTFDISKDKQAAIAARLISLRSAGKSPAPPTPDSGPQPAQALAP
jgi:membrane-bound ClpP family serine protease